MKKEILEIAKKCKYYNTPVDNHNPEGPGYCNRYFTCISGDHKSIFCDGKCNFISLKIISDNKHMKYGYMRVSTKEQKLDSQRFLLSKEKCDKIFSEKQSGVKERCELNALLEEIKPGDTLVITRLDRLGRSLKELINIVEQLSKKNVHFISIKEGINTSSSMGRLFFHINAAYAEFEREKLIERTKEGMNAARKAGRLLGRRKGLTEEADKKAEYAAALYKDYKRNHKYSINELCELVGITKATFYKYVKLKNAY